MNKVKVAAGIFGVAMLFGWITVEALKLWHVP